MSEFAKFVDDYYTRFVRVFQSFDRYGEAEDAHRSVMHGLTQYLRQRNLR